MNVEIFLIFGYAILVFGLLYYLTCIGPRIRWKKINATTTREVANKLGIKINEQESQERIDLETEKRTPGE
jgi:hypothetical protein